MTAESPGPLIEQLAGVDLAIAQAGCLLAVQLASPFYEFVVWRWTIDDEEDVLLALAGDTAAALTDGEPPWPEVRLARADQIGDQLYWRALEGGQPPALESHPALHLAAAAATNGAVRVLIAIQRSLASRQRPEPDMLEPLFGAFEHYRVQAKLAALPICYEGALVAGWAELVHQRLPLEGCSQSLKAAIAPAGQRPLLPAMAPDRPSRG